MWFLQKVDSKNFLINIICFYLDHEYRIAEFLKFSMVRILRSTPRLLGCFQKSFHIVKVKNPNVPLRKFFRFFNFVPHDPNYHPPNFCAIKTIFDRERAKILKITHCKILRQVPTLIPCRIISFLWCGFIFRLRR